MATPQLITRDNFQTLLQRSTQPRGSTPDGNVYFDTTNDRIQLITAGELAQVDLGSGLEANPFTSTLKMQALALYFFLLQEVQADANLQRFRRSMDAVANRMGRLVGATSFLNDVVCASGTVDANGVGGELGDDRLKLADSGITEFNVAGAIKRVYHGAKSLNPINATTQPYYLLAASLSEADRQAATPVDFSKPGSINELIQTFGDATNGNFDSRAAVLINCAREFGYTIGEANSLDTGVAELGAYAQGYGIGNAVVNELSGIALTDVRGGGAIPPYTNLGFFRHGTPQTRTGFSSSGAGASGNFTDEITLSSGTMSLVQLRAFLDAVMLEDADVNDNSGATGTFLPKRAEPLYTISSTGQLVTRTGLYVDPARLTAEAQQQIQMTNDAGGLHSIPFNSGLEITVSDAWINDANPWFRILYVSATSGNYDTDNAVTVLDSSAGALAGDATDARLSGNTITAAYAYDTETGGGEVTAGVDHDMVLQIGGTDTTKTRTVFFTMTKTSTISVDGTTEAETN